MITKSVSTTSVVLGSSPSSAGVVSAPLRVPVVSKSKTMSTLTGYVPKSAIGIDQKPMPLVLTVFSVIAEH